MGDMVIQFIRNCTACSRSKTHFRQGRTQLQPLPIRGLFYRWGIDFCGPFPPTAKGNKYIIVAVDHFSKWAEFMAVPDKSAKTTSDALLDHILARFGALGEVITDQGSEFEGAFHTLLNQHHITHRTPGKEHPQSDGLAERLVQTLKSALRKTLFTRHRQDWDLYLPYIAMGYRMTKQASTGYTPYYLTYGRHPLFQANNQDAEHDFLPLDKNLPKFLEERGKLYQ